VHCQREEDSRREVRASLGGGGTGGQPDISTLIQQVQQACRQACNFLPLANDVAAVIQAMGVPTGGALAVANLICSSPLIPAGRLRTAAPAKRVVVNGRVIVVHSQ
jgi:hypothetical protein